ncbi:MAG: FtsX-like permease family protein [bacterium]|nr:FtsX-like permease family protein [bacterium]
MKKGREHPPQGLAGKLLRIFIRDSDRQYLLGDLEEHYGNILKNRGRLFAFLWYWYQTLIPFPDFIMTKISWSATMIQNYLKIAFRNIKRNKSFSALNIIGFAVGIAAYLLIGLYINYELSYDEYHENADRVYQVFTNHAATTPAPLGPVLMSEFSEVESATRVQDDGGFLLRYGDKVFIEEEWVWADKHIFDIFTFPLVMGDKNVVLDNPYSIVITEETAERYFGDENPVNEVLNCTFPDGTVKDFTITGVLKNIPENSYVKGDFFAVFETLSDLGNYLDNWGNWNYDTFYLLGENADPIAFEEKYPVLLESKYNQRSSIGFYSKRLTDMHLKSKGVRHLFGQVNDIKYIYLFSVIAITILFMACINYLNLSTARSIQRGKEVGVRKAAGAKRSQLIYQFLGESLILTVISLVIAIVLVYLLLPVFNSLVNSEGTIELFNDMTFLMILLISVLFVGLLSGSYPALFMSKFNPSTTLKGSSLTSTSGVRLRNTLVVVQFSISIILIISTIVTSRQVNYLRTKKLGYSKDQIVVVPIKDSVVNDQKQALKNELLSKTEITSVSFPTTIPLKVNWMNNYRYNNPDDPEDNIVNSYYARVDYDYLDLFEMEFAFGRKFDRELDEGKNVYIINEAICRQLGWEDPIGKEYTTSWQYNRGTKGKIIGVVKDFHNNYIPSSISPVTLVLDPDDGRMMSIKMNTDDVQKTLTAVEEVWKQFSSGYPFEFEFMDEMYDAMYKSEIRRGRSFNYFSVLAIFICCLGLFGLASFTIEQSIKEIGIRKVLGASSFTVIKMLLWKFLEWTIIANIVAFPIAYVIMSSWLQEYAYRIDLGWGTFVLAGIIATMIAFLTVITLTIKATRANPVDSLRYE